MVSFSGQGVGLRCGPTPAPCAETRAHPQAGSARAPGMGRYSRPRAGGRRGEASAVSRETAAINRPGRRQLGSRTDDLIGLRAATLPSPTRKPGPTVKKEAENPIYVLSAFCGGSGTWIPCPYCHAFIPCSPCPGYCPESRSFSPPFIVPTTTRRLSARPRRLAALSPAPFP